MGHNQLMDNRLLISAALLFSLPQSGAAQVVGGKTASRCISFADEQAKVTVTGRLSVSTFTDPYGTERAYLVQLPDAVCLDDGGEFANSNKRFARVQVSGTNDALDKVLRASVGRKVKVSGEAFAAHTRHHHVPLVVIADQITYPER